MADLLVSVSVELTFSVFSEHMTLKDKGAACMTLGKGFLCKLFVYERDGASTIIQSACPVMETPT